MMESSVQILSPARYKVPFAGQDASRSADRNAETKMGFPCAGNYAQAPLASARVPLDGSPAGLSHDVRNMLSALNLYCDLLAEPAVLNPGYRHYAEELRLVAQAGSSLLSRLSRLASAPQMQPTTSANSLPRIPAATVPPPLGTDPDVSVFVPFNLTTELESCHKLLAALAGPSIHMDLDCGSYTGPMSMPSEDLTRILINLVRNAAEAMPHGGRIQIAVQPCVDVATGLVTSISLTVEDDGPGIATEDLPHLFKSGYTTKRSIRGKTSWLTPELHGLGLGIVRALVESAGGTIKASSPAGKGARFALTLPVGTANVAPTEEVEVESNFIEGSRVQC